MGKTKKIVINACFGGFGLSTEGLQMYAKLKGIKLFHYKQTKYKHNGIEEYKKVNSSSSSCLFVLTLKKDLGDIINEIPNEDNLWFNDDSIDREDLALIKIVEEDSEKVSGDCAKLKIIEIPYDVDYIIEDYDGNEHIAKKHQTWG